LRGRGDDQVLMVAGIVFVAFSFWMILAHGIFAIFMAESGIGSAENVEMLLTSLSAIAMLAVGSVVGRVIFAFALYAITVMSLPMLVRQGRRLHHRDHRQSGHDPLRTKSVMFGWAAIIAVST
jgi:uncharacterized membrane protein